MGGDRRHAAQPAAHQRLPALALGQPQHVLDVDEAQQPALGDGGRGRVVALGADREAGEAGDDHELLELVGGDRLGHGDQPVEREHDGGRRLLPELERAGQPLVLLLVEQPLLAGVLDDPGELVGRERRRQLVLGLDAEGAQQPVAEGVEPAQHRTGERGEAVERRHEQQRRALRGGDGDVLGDHLAEHHVQEDHERQGDREGDRVQQRLRHPGGLQHVLEQVRDGGLGDRAETERAQRDAELRACQHQRQVAQRVQHDLGAPAAVGQRLDLAAPHADDGELGPDEEGVAGQEQHGGEQRGDGHAAPCPARSSASGGGTSCTRSTRRPSSSSTVSCQPSTSTTSPFLGSRPRRAMTRPPRVS